MRSPLRSKSMEYAIFFLNRKEARCIASSMVSVIFISSFRMSPYHGNSKYHIL